MKKNILILGGAGFIGYNLSKYLLKNKNNNVTIADNQFRGKKDEYLTKLLENDNSSFVEADFTIPESFNKLQSSYDYVYMLASVVGVNNTLEIPHEIIRINSLLIINTLEWIRHSNIKKVLFTSTSENYAGTIDTFGFKIPTPENIPLTISDISHPRFTYAVTKMLGESGFLNYSKSLGFECCVVRYHNVYGPRMGFKHVIPHLAERFLNKESPFKIYGHDQTRAFCYIDDAVKGTVAAMENNKSNGQIYHIGTEEEISIEELIKESGLFFNYSGQYVNAPTYPGSTKRRCPDISKAKLELNYQPDVSWKDGLKLTLEWYKEFFSSGSSTFETSFKKPDA
jgi:UDP-glucose 4-epimerase